LARGGPELPAKPLVVHQPAGLERRLSPAATARRSAAGRARQVLERRPDAVAGGRRSPDRQRRARRAGRLEPRAPRRPPKTGPLSGADIPYRPACAPPSTCNVSPVTNAADSK